jgi:outer membrane usher protein FimD/PapC
MGVGYYSPLNKLTTIYLRADLSEHNVNPTIEYDSFTYTLQAGAVHKFNADLSLSAQLIHQQHSVDGARYREMDGVAANLVNVLNAKTSVQIGASYLNFTYNDLDNKDAQEYNFSLGYNRQVPLFGTSLIMARLSFGEDKPDEDNNITQSTSEREFWGSSLAHKIPLSNTIVLTSTIAYQHSEYAADDLLFAVTREDETFSFDVTADWRLNKQWRLSGGAGWREQDSNIEIYNFDRMYGQVGIRYEYY